MIQIAAKYAIAVFVAQLIVFFILKALGVTENTTLVIFNIVLQLVFVYLAIREYRLSGKSRAGHYLSGVGMGLTVVVLGALAFSIFLYAYLSGNADYMKALENDSQQARFMNPLASSGVLFGGAIAVGVVGSYILTRIVDNNLSPTNTNVNSTEAE